MERRTSLILKKTILVHSEDFYPSSSKSSKRQSINDSNIQLLQEFNLTKNGPGPGKYSRSSSIGHLNHDITLNRNPAFSIGKAPRVLNKDYYECILEFIVAFYYEFIFTFFMKAHLDQARTHMKSIVIHIKDQCQLFQLEERDDLLNMFYNLDKILFFFQLLFLF